MSIERACRRAGACCALIALPALALPAFAQADSLQGFYESVQQADPRLAIASATADVAAAQGRQARAALLPKAALQGSLTRTRQKRGGVMAFEPSYYDGERYAVTLQQPLFDAGRIRAYQAGRALVRRSAHEVALTQSDVRLDAVDRYLAALTAAVNADLARQEEQAAAVQLAQMRALQARQLATTTEVYTIEARAAVLHARRLQAETELRVALDVLALLAGRNVVDLRGLEESAGLPAIGQRLADWEERAGRASPRVLALQEETERARLQVGQQRAATLPVFSLQLAAQESNIGYENALAPRNETAVVALNASLPLFAGGAVLAAIGEARAQERIARRELEATQRDALTQTRAAFMQLQSLEARISAARAAVTAADRSLAANERGYQLNVVTIVDVLDARGDTYAARRDLAEARHEYLRQWATLRHAAGTLGDADMRLISDVLTRPVGFALPQ